MKTDLSALGGAGEKILVIKPSSLGDVVHTLPAVAALAAACPGASIHWLANTEWAPLLTDHPALSGVIEFPRRQFRGWGQIGQANRWARENLRPLRPALALDFQGLLRSALLGRAAAAGQVVGFTRSREGAAQFYHDRIDVPDWDRLHAVDRYLRLVSALTEGHGRAVPASEGAEPVFDLPAGEAIEDSQDDATKRVLESDFVVLHPFSRGRAKSLSAAEVRRFCEILSPMPVVIAGSDVREFSPPLAGNAINLLGRTSISQLIWLLRRSRWTVSVDSGPMHLAAALSDRLLAIHSWTNPRVVGPCRAGAWIWRDGFIGRVGDIAADQFPERRQQARKLAGGSRHRDPDLLGAAAIDTLSEFVAGQLQQGAAPRRPTAK